MNVISKAPDDNTMSLVKPRALTPYKKRHSTVGAAEFFHGGIQWSDIPSRLQMLVFHLQKDAHLAATETRSITLSKNPMEARLIALTAAISNAATFEFWTECKAFFLKMIQWYIWSSKRVKNTDEDSSDEDSDENEDDEFFTALFTPKSTFFQNLHILQFLNPQNPMQLDIFTQPLNQALHETVTSYICKTITGIYDREDLLDGIMNWKNEELAPLLHKLTSDISLDERLNHTINECYCQTRQNEIFDMIADYPDSYHSFVDLNRAIQKTHKMNALVKDLKEALRKRLLHPGAQTGQILQVYMDMIQVLRIIDPSDTLLNNVSGDIRAYLRGRSDTVRCIITR